MYEITIYVPDSVGVRATISEGQIGCVFIAVDWVVVSLTHLCDISVSTYVISKKQDF